MAWRWSHSVATRWSEAGRWWHSWYDVSSTAGSPTLLTFAAGPCTRNSRMVGLVEPERVHVTRWQDDPYLRGSYLYMSVGSDRLDHDNLAIPIDDVLHLAGEPTWTDDPSTVTGALKSGHRGRNRSGVVPSVRGGLGRAQALKRRFQISPKPPITCSDFCRADRI